MARFFNRMRKNGLSSKNWSDYITYAIGEIALVVIGILIALYINNWNENRKGALENRTLLQELKNENRLNLEDLQEDVPYRDTLHTSIYEFHEFLTKEDFLEHRDSLNNYLIVLSRLNTYEPNNNYLQKYIDYNSNNQTALSDELIRLNERQRALKLISDTALELRFEKFFDFLAKDVDFKSLEMENTDIFKSLEFRNNLILIASIEEGLYEVFNKSLVQQRKIDSLITIALEEK